MFTYYYDNGEPENPEWSKNWGDIIGPTIIKHFSKSDKIQPADKKVEGKLVSIGSVMEAARPNDFIWGTGVIMANNYLPHLRKVKVFATRGPKTRDYLIYLGHEVPEVYGDPGLLYPQIYNPHIEQTHEWGVIPHYMDVKHPVVKTLIERGFKLIDICAGEHEFVNQLKSVKKVLSSSLHGLIAADAYGIPNARIRLSENIVGGDWKFEDYALSVGRKNFKGIEWNGQDLNTIELNESIDWNPQPLLDNAPWMHEEYKELFY